MQITQKTQEYYIKWITPLKAAPLVGTLTDVAKTKKELILENALLRHQLLILNRQVKKT
jgi:hypothetical protein